MLSGEFPLHTAFFLTAHFSQQDYPVSFFTQGLLSKAEPHRAFFLFPSMDGTLAPPIVLCFRIIEAYVPESQVDALAIQGTNSFKLNACCPIIRLMTCPATCMGAKQRV